MITSPITIEEGRVTIRPVSGNVWMTQHEIADLFGVFIAAGNSNIRSILKNEVLREETVCRHKRHGNGDLTILYDLEMITALAFRLKSPKAEQYRRWIIGQAVSSSSSIVLWQLPCVSAMVN